MRVIFTKHVERRVVTWEAVRGTRTRVPGPTMALGRGELPHDLAQLVVDWPTLHVHAATAARPTSRSLGRMRRHV